MDICYRPQRSCGKGIFSQACVKNSVHRGRMACMTGRHACWGGMRSGRGVWQGGMHGRGVCVAEGYTWWGGSVAGKTEIAAGGRHPTRMHSC